MLEGDRRSAGTSSSQSGADGITVTTGAGGGDVTAATSDVDG